MNIVESKSSIALYQVVDAAYSVDRREAEFQKSYINSINERTISENDDENDQEDWRSQSVKRKHGLNKLKNEKSGSSEK